MRRTIDAVLASIRPVDLPGMTADSRVSSIDEAIQRYRDNGAQLRIVAARLSAIMQGMSGVIAMVILVWGVWRMTEQRDGFGSLIALQTIFLTFAGAVQQLASAAVSMGADFAVVKEMYSFHDFSAPENWET